MGLTHYLARAAGFGVEDARKLGELDQGKDLGEHSPFKSWIYYSTVYQGPDRKKRLRKAMDIHFPIGPGDRVAVKNSAYVNERVDEKIEQGNFEGFAKELHTYQDSWSHAGFAEQHGLSHKPDYTYIENRWEGRDLEMARAVYSKMESFLDWNSKYRVSPSAPFPESWVKDYLKIENNREKQVVLQKAGLSEYGPRLIGYRVVETREGKVSYPIYQWRFEEFEEAF